MSARQAALAVALVFVAAQVALAQDDRAVPRGGGSSGGSGGRDHHSGGASSSRDTGSSSSGSHSGDSASRREPTGAQARHPRAGTGTGHSGDAGRTGEAPTPCLVYTGRGSGTLMLREFPRDWMTLSDRELDAVRQQAA